MIIRYRFGVPLLSAAFAVACGQGSGATIDNTGPTPGMAGASTAAAGSGQASGGTSAATAGTAGTGAQPIAGSGGSDSSTGGSDSSTGGSDSSTGGTSSAGSGGSAPLGGSGGSLTGTPGANSGAGPWGTPVSGGPTATGTMTTATITVNRGTVKGNLGPGYAGFSLEKTHMTNSSLTSSNANLIALFKLIGPTSLRVGADDVDLCNWVPATKPGGGGPPYTLHVGTAMVDELGDFVTATGAKLIYGVNFKSNDVTNSVTEATYAASKLGASITGFEIGNEINKYGSWSALKTQWENFGTGIKNAVPSAVFIGPATTAGGTGFATSFAADESAKFGSKLVQLTHHYYVGGAGTTAATVAALQTIKSDIVSIGVTLNTAVKTNKISNGWRMGEANSFFGHGQMGISDTLIGGLWSIDFMFQEALNGASGVNFHGGETGMDGTKPFYYEPIMENNGAVIGVQPVYYGMLLVYLAGQGQVLDTTVSSSNPNLNAYAVDYKADGSTSVVLVNKNGTTGVNATVNVGSAVTSASAIFLQGKTAGTLNAAANEVTLAGSAVTTAGAWNRNPPYTQTTSGNTVTVFVPPATAALVRVR